MSKPTEKLHSADYFDESRNYWWNLDFLRLMGNRWQVQNITSVLDVGCGQGHWGQILAQILPVDATVVGIDQELEWIEEAYRQMQKSDLSNRFRYEYGKAEAIPFPDGTFDLVTCQTVLIHMADPVSVLKEMVRVLKIGGLLIVAEPNNLAGVLTFSNLSSRSSIEQICQTVEFQATCERGKINLGKGNSSVGDLIPGYFTQIGLDNIQTYISDKTSPMFPPYASKEQQITKQLSFDWIDRGRWDRNEALEYFLAGGGTEQAFDEHWLRMLKENRLVKQSILNEEFHMGGGVIMYLVSGQKPNLLELS